LIAPDELTVAYLRQRAPDLQPVMTSAMADWRQLRSDVDARFDSELEHDAATVAPRVTWGTSPDQSISIHEVIPTPSLTESGYRRASHQRALDYMGLAAGAPIEGLAIDRVFIGSCTNSRIEDLRAVARVVRGRKVREGVRAMVVPGSGAVRAQAEEEGIAAVLIEAGFEWRQSGCSMCLAMNDDVLKPGERCASTTNRNFEGRQGRRGRTHLMSPAMAAAAALTGFITDVRKLRIEHDAYDSHRGNCRPSADGQSGHGSDHAQAILAWNRQVRSGEGIAL
jgi:3-isopropylmalate/(R)-2-methylmalate dehydratase large subunit